MNQGQKVSVSVHERVDGVEGFCIRVTADQDGHERVARYPVPNRAEADALAEAFVDFLEAGLPLQVVLPEVGP